MASSSQQRIMNSLIPRTVDARQESKRARLDETALLGTFSQDIARQSVTLSMDGNMRGDYGSLNGFNRREGGGAESIRGLADVQFQQGAIADHSGAEEFMSLSLRVASDNMDVTRQIQRMNILIVPRQLTSTSQPTKNWSPAYHEQMLNKMNQLMAASGGLMSADASRHMELHRGEIYNAMPIQLVNYILAKTHQVGTTDVLDLSKHIGLVVPVISEDGKIDSVSSRATRTYLPVERLFAVGVGGTCLVANFWGAVSPGDRLYFVLRRLADDRQQKRYGFNATNQYNLRVRGAGEINNVEVWNGNEKPFQLVPVAGNSSGFIDNEHWIENRETYSVFEFGTVVEKASVPALPSSDFNKGVFSMSTWMSLCCSAPLRVSVRLGCPDLQHILTRV